MLFLGKYYFLFSLSIDTELNIREEMIIKDIYGNDHELTQHHVRVMVGVGWACFLGSWIINIAYYKFHPSSVDLFSFSEKKKLYVFGKDVFSLSQKTKRSRSQEEVEGDIY